MHDYEEEYDDFEDLSKSEAPTPNLLTYKALGTVGFMWNDSAYKKFWATALDMTLYSQRFLCGPAEYIHVEHAPASYHELGRNHLVQHMRGDWLLSLDTDHTLAPDLLERLLIYADKYNCDVLSGIYASKHPPHTPVMGLWNPLGGVDLITQWPQTPIFPVGVVGAGVLLVRRHVFQRIHDELKERPFTIVPGLSEDYSFCLRCKRLGIPVYVAPLIQAHHLIVTALDVEGSYEPITGANIHHVGGALDGSRVAEPQNAAC